MKITEALIERRHRKSALLAANFYNAETLLALIRAARATGLPLILQTSPSTIEYLGLRMTVAMAKAAIEELEGRAWLHLDHCRDFGLITQAIEAGYDSVMIDASEEPLEENIRETTRIVEIAHAAGVAVEAELGYVAKLGQAELTPDGLTDPSQAGRFAEATGVDFLAVAIGTAHGFYKRPPALDLPRLEAIAREVAVPLVLHGGSGLSPAQMRAAIERGIAKVNFATEIKDTFTRVLKERLNNSREIDIRKTFPPAQERVEQLVAGKMIICDRKENV